MKVNGFELATHPRSGKFRKRGGKHTGPGCKDGLAGTNSSGGRQQSRFFTEAEKRSNSTEKRSNAESAAAATEEASGSSSHGNFENLDRKSHRRSDSSHRVRIDRKKSRLMIADVSAEDLQLVSEVSLECIDCVESLMSKARAIHAPYDLRDLSLTLATLERQLYNYVSDHLLRSRERRFLPIPGHGRGLGSRYRKHERRTLQAVMRKAHEMLDDGHIPLICGGVASLLYNLKGALLETKVCVNNLSFFFYTTPHDAGVAAAMVVGAAAGVWKLRKWLSISLQVLSATRPARWNGPMSTPISIQLHVRKSKTWLGLAVRIWRRVYAWLRRTPQAKAMFYLLVAGYLTHLLMRYRSMEKLRACHRQLLLLQRIMGNVTFALDEARIRRARSYVELVAFPSKRHDSDTGGAKPASRLLVENVAYPCQPYLHQYTHGRHYVLKRALDVLYSSMGVSWSLTGRRKWLALLLTQVAAPYFILHPKKASSYAAGVRQHMMPELFRFVCWSGNNPVARYLCLALFCRNFSTKCALKITGLPGNTYVFQKTGTSPPCAKKGVIVGLLPWQHFVNNALKYLQPDPVTPPALPHGGPVLIYIHGGGFCTNLLTMDLPFVSMVAQAIPRAPIVMSEYSEAPEKPFPAALDELCILYEWVRHGGLGFKPSRVVLAGESAGANFICSLCIRYIGAHHPDLACDAGGDCKSVRQSLGFGPQPPIRAPLPDEIVIGYPALNLGASPSPSRALHMCDPVLPVAAGNLAKAYHGDNAQTLLNPQVSPIFTSDAVLSHFPPTSIMTGGMDILLDDAVDFHVRLRRNGVPGAFRIFRTLPHGFWSMGGILPEASEAQELAVEWIAKAMLKPTGLNGDSSDDDDLENSNSSFASRKKLPAM